MYLLKLYIQGMLSEEQEIELFQSLIDSGEVWEMSKSYQNKAYYFIENGYCQDV